MFRFVPTCTIKVAAFAVAVVVLGWTTDRAEATCGGYVYVRGQRLHVEHSAIADDPASAGVNSPAGSQRMLPIENDSHSPGRTPCNGPSCSNGSVPPATPVPSEPASTEQWACSISGGLALQDSSSMLLPAADVEPAEGVGLSLIRPPR